MSLRFVKMLSWLLYAAILFPTVGPLIDHHFAERQPGHLHVGVVALHAHSYGDAHGHTGEATNSSNSGYNFETVQLISIFHSGDELGLMSFLQFSPDSLFVLPPESLARINEPDHGPPDQPPQPAV